MVEQAGVDVDKLVNLLVKNASAELTTYYYYTIMRVNLIGLKGEGIKGLLPRMRVSRIATTSKRWFHASTSWAARCLAT